MNNMHYETSSWKLDWSYISSMIVENIEVLSSAALIIGCFRYSRAYRQSTKLKVGLVPSEILGGTIPTQECQNIALSRCCMFGLVLFLA